MLWKKSPVLLFSTATLFLLALEARAADSDGNASTAVATATAPAPAPAPEPVKIKAKDIDDEMIVLNRPGIITLVLITNEDSQDAARAAGKSLYPLQGRPDFQLVVVVDLRDSLATWVPSVAISQMKANLDSESEELKAYYRKNGNTSNPRSSSYVIADFNGVVCPQLGLPTSSDELRGIVFGPDGREIKRWDKLSDLNQLQLDLRAAITAWDAKLVEQAKAARSNPNGDNPPVAAPEKLPPPLLPYTPVPKPND